MPNEDCHDLHALLCIHWNAKVVATEIEQPPIALLWNGSYRKSRRSNSPSFSNKSPFLACCTQSSLYPRRVPVISQQVRLWGLRTLACFRWKSLSSMDCAARLQVSLVCRCEDLICDFA